MAHNIISCLDVGMKSRRPGLNSFSLAPGRKQFQTKTVKATIEEGYFRAKESEEWDTFSSDDSAIESDSQPSTPTSIFTSAGENIPDVGIFAGKARALANCCSSPFNRGGEAAKNNDIDIFANLNKENWNGILQGKVGHYKNVEVGEQKNNHKHRGNNIDWSKLPSKPKTLEELQKLIIPEEYTNVLNVYDESDTLRREIEKVDLNRLTNENLEHNSEFVNEEETLQGAEDLSDDGKFFEPTATSSPKKKITDLINSPIKKIQIQPKIYDFPDEENFHLGPTITSTKKPINATFIKAPSETPNATLSKNFDCDKLTTEPVSKGKESPKAALKRKKLERYRRKMAKVPICDIIIMCQK
ncbi:SAM domain-containing protein SAMSN-1 isoform X2 [Parasteatoda tepidariorum]|uniref:SAM domain-containing protein SAMSN-1 isoform X2 n=1 Tax=Parasteatoda tepidariorum TaxID=114398 RepID=UPI001C71960D|nr:SAM domain-containing protein SAMSN-1 isoform X2 [Parasteatoda tepidariorum]